MWKQHVAMEYAGVWGAGVSSLSGSKIAFSDKQQFSGMNEPWKEYGN